MKESVISLICVAAWNMPISRPAASADSSIGAASSAVTTSACWPTEMMVSGVIARSLVEARRERADQERPAVHEHEQHDLERQRDQHRREHHHAHRHQHARDDEVDHEERNEDQEADLK